MRRTRWSPGAPPPLLSAALAIGLTALYALWLAPEWEPVRDDQTQYLALARGLVERGEFTRAVGSEAFIPEPLRALGYPAFLALLCKFVGCGHGQIALAQAVIFAAIVLLGDALARSYVSPHLARIVALGVALYAPIAYFAALALSELLTTFLLMLGVWAFRRADSPWLILSAGALGAAALTRPLFMLLVAPLTILALAERRTKRDVFLFTSVFVLAVAPAFVYSFATLGRPFTSSAGAQLWLGYFQARDPRSFDAFTWSQVEAGRARLAEFDAETDRARQPAAFIGLNEELGARALDLIAHDPAGYAIAALPRSVELWAGDTPVKEGTEVPGPIRVAILAAQLILFGVGLTGAIALGRRGGPFAWLPLLLIGYVWAFSVPLWTEARFSLPAKPVVILAAVGVLPLLRGGSGQVDGRGTRGRGGPALGDADPPDLPGLIDPR